MWTYIGPFGNLLQIKCPTPGMSAPIERAGSEQFTLDGYRFIQRPTVAVRRWEMQIELATPDDVRHLYALELGVYGPPPWQWYNPAAAHINMLTPWLSAPGVPGPRKWVSGSATALIYSAPNVMEVPSAALQALSPAVPVFPGRDYVASADILDRPGGTSTGVLSMRWVDAAGATISTVTSAAETSPNRLVVTGEAPVNAAGVVLILDPNVSTTGRFGSIQLREGTTDDVEWHVGMGVEGVSIATGLQQIYQEVYDDVRDGVVRSVSATLLEVQSA